MEFNNPASRLHKILVDLKHANPNNSASTVLSSSLGVENNPKSIIQAVVKFHDLIKEVTEYASKTNLPSGPLARYIPQLESAVSFSNFDTAWTHYQGRLTPECIVTIEMIAQIDNIKQDDEISQESLRELSDKVSDLFNEIQADDALEKDFKVFVLNQLEAIRRAISEYRISGAMGFAKYIETLIIDAAKSSELLKRDKNSTSGALTKFKKILKLVASFASCTDSGLAALKNVKDIYEFGIGLLEDKSSESEPYEAKVIEV